jgi:hypothetical protein
MSIARNSTRTLTVRLPLELWELWDEYCRLKGVPKKALMARYIAGLREEVERLKAERSTPVK